MMDAPHRMVGRVLPVTHGESPHKAYPAHTVHIEGHHEWPPRPGDTQGINYPNYFASMRCKHNQESLRIFFWVKYDRGIESFKGHVCADCGRITWAYTDLGKD